MNLSEKQIARIQYESMLMKLSPQSIQVIAPWLFIEGITAANTEVEIIEDPVVKEVEKITEIEEITASEDFYNEMLGW
jgi:hypothetical protein